MTLTFAHIEAAAAELRNTLPVFTRGNLRHATRRVLRGQALTERAFEAKLARYLAREPIDGLLPLRACARGVALSRAEEVAYFPAGVLLVDRPAIVDLFAASGALVQARIAVVDVHGYPAPVVDWLVRGARRGHRAPVGFLHDAATALYPFLLEPLASLSRSKHPPPFRDLGIGAGGSMRDPITRGRERELEAVTPAALVSYAARGVLSMLAGDDMLRPVSSS